MNTGDISKVVGAAIATRYIDDGIDDLLSAIEAFRQAKKSLEKLVCLYEDLKFEEDRKEGK